MPDLVGRNFCVKTPNRLWLADHGGQYTAQAYGQRLCDAGLVGSMGTTGDAYDKRHGRGLLRHSRVRADRPPHLARPGGGPTTEAIANDPADLPIEKLTWPTTGNPVELHKAVGGCHGWPGGPQYVPRFLIGRISRTFDATAVVLDLALRVVAG